MNYNRQPLISVFMFVIVIINVTAGTWLVGPSRTYKTPNAVSGLVASGDTVLIDTGTYAGEVSTWNKSNLTLRGTGEFAHMVAPAVISNGKAIWVVQGNNTVIENIEFSNARVPDSNGAGIRQEGNNVTIRHCFFHDNENGILGAGDTTSNVIIEYSEFAYNGAGDGYSHNMYIGRAGSFTLRFCNTHHAKIGHNVKTRARMNYILYNRIMDEADGTASYEIDIPDGGTSYVIGNVVQQGPATDNPTIITFAEESTVNPGRDLYVVNNTVVNDRTSGGTFVRVGAATATSRVINNLFVGNGTILSGPGDTVSNVLTSAPGFVSKATYDYHLASGSVAINKGTNPGMGNGYSLAPLFQYVANAAGTARTAVGAIDAGAFEFGMATVLTRSTTVSAVKKTNSHGYTHELNGRKLGKVKQDAAMRVIDW